MGYCARINHISVKSPRPPTLPTLVQYSGTIIKNSTGLPFRSDLPLVRLYAIHYTPYNMGNNNIV